MKPNNNQNARALPPPILSWNDTMETAVTVLVPRLAGLTLKTALGVTVALYVLNQSHMLPKRMAAAVSKFLFYPTLPITASKRIGKWVTKIDDTLLLGGAPFAMLDYPRKLKEDYGVEGVINMCEEWKGPLKEYKKLGIEELYLPTTDHFEPSQEDLISALSFIKRYEAKGKSVYVHCRAGHGRSGAVAYAWLLCRGYPTSLANPESVNANLRKLRDVRKTLWKQPNLSALRDRLVRSKGKLVDLNDDFFREQHQEQKDGGDGDDKKKK